ncbi:MAG: hypothetical protein ACYDB8_11760 [Acidiferrobacterales bacterium]
MPDLLKSEFLRTLIEGSVLLPGVVAVLYGIATRHATRAGARWSEALWAPGLLAGFLSGYAAAYRDFSFPPHTVLSWLPWLVVAGAALVVLGGWSAGKYGMHGARALASAASAFILLRPILHQERPFTAIISWLGVTVLWFLLWVGLVSSRDDQRSAGTALLSTAGTLALIAPLSGSIELARLSASLAVALAAGLVFSLLIARTRWRSPTADVPILILGALLVELRFYAGASLGMMAWLIASLAAACAAIALMRRYTIDGRWSVMVPGLATLLPVALAIWTAVRLFRQSGNY